MVMNISSLGSSSLYSTSATSSRNFRSTQETVSKDDLSQLASDLKSSGTEASNLLQTLQTNFEKIDTNGDGISFDELQAYAKANGLTLPKGPARGDMQGTPPALSKDDLTKMRDDIAADDSEAADGLTQVINNFDDADTNQDGEISFDEMQTYTKANNIEMPKPDGGQGKTGSMPSIESDDQNSISSDNEKGLLKMLRQMCLQTYDTYSTASFSGSALEAGLSA
jgi:hypothetical protein